MLYFRRPFHEPNEGWCGYNSGFDSSEPTEFIPPLVRAVHMGNTALVQLLIAHGADVNVGYHDLRPISPKRRRGKPNVADIFWPCGRPAQLALISQDIVELLLDAGADINLKPPAWQYHVCAPRPRDTYLRVTAGLRAAASKAK
jgi:serum/glucocorticoid-regulated kinase 2